MKIKLLEKIIKYRLSYSGAKETDLLYKKYFLSNLHKYEEKDLKLLKKLLDKYSDNQIYSFLINETVPPYKFNKLFIKFLNEK